MLWLRAYARKKRWDEEIILLILEMECTIRSFTKKSEDWKAWGQAADGRGHKAYAARQASVWTSLRAHAEASFAKEGIVVQC